jgi:hypothetical protein
MFWIGTAATITVNIVALMMAPFRQTSSCR